MHMYARARAFTHKPGVGEQEAFDGSKATDDTVEKLLLAVPASGASCMASLAAEVKLALAERRSFSQISRSMLRARTDLRAALEVSRRDPSLGTSASLGTLGIGMASRPWVG